jgi:hypothetical protein
LDKKYRKAPIAQATTSMVRRQINFDKQVFAAKNMDSNRTQTVNAQPSRNDEAVYKYSSERELNGPSNFQKKSLTSSYVSRDKNSNYSSFQPNAEYIEIKNEREEILNSNVKAELDRLAKYQIENDSNMNIKEYLQSNNKLSSDNPQENPETGRFSVLEVAEKVLESKVLRTLIGKCPLLTGNGDQAVSRVSQLAGKKYQQQKGPHFLSYENHDQLNYRPSFATPMSEMETSIFNKYFQTHHEEEDISDASLINSNDESFKREERYQTDYFGDEQEANRYGKFDKRSNVSSNISYGFMKSAIKRK